MAELFDDIALARTTVTSRIHDMADDMRDQMRRMDYDFYSIALDESTDILNKSQLAVFVRLWDKNTNRIYEELLELVY